MVALDDSAPLEDRASLRLSGSIDAVVRSLAASLGSTVDASVIRAAVEAEYGVYANVRVTAFVPILVESRVRARLARGPNTA